MGSHTGNARQRCSMLLSSFCPERLRVVPPDLSPISTCFPHWPVTCYPTLNKSHHQENRGLYVSQSGKTSDRLLSCDPSWSVTHSFMLISSVFFCFSHSWVFKKSILLVSTFCLKELRLGAQRSLYFYKTTLEKIHLNFESNLIEKLINLVLCCLISHSLWRVSSLNLCY